MFKPGWAKKHYKTRGFRQVDHTLPPGLVAVE